IVFFLTILFQKFKEKRAQRRKKNVLKKLLHMNYKKAIDAIAHQLKYINKMLPRININLEGGIIIEEPINRSNEIIEEIGYNTIFDTLDLHTNEDWATQFSLSWESLKVYKLAVHTINNTVGNFTTFYN